MMTTTQHSIWKRIFWLPFVCGVRGHVPEDASSDPRCTRCGLVYTR